MKFRFGWCAIAAIAVIPACDGTVRTGRAPSRTVTLTVMDEAGAEVASARLTLVGRASPMAVDGSRDLHIDQPVAGVLHADGYLDEPVAFDPHDGSVRVRMIARVGPSGSVRRALQFGGDVMLGRRYQSTAPQVDTAIARNADAARAVVADIAPLMAAADASMVNLETVVGDLPPLDAYPGKRFLIESPPFVVDALEQMGVDLVALGNNHAYDWMEGGIRSTVAHLDERSMPWVGAGVDARQAEQGRIISVAGLQVGVLSTTTANGDFVNDSLPLTGDPVRPEVSERYSWQYDERAFRFGTPGDPAYVAPATRLAGDMWQLYQTMEPDLSDEAAAALWTEVRRVFPELLDSVARRGHGGAARFRRFDVARQVQALRDQGADVVVVQIHGGTQFSEVPSESMRRVTHDAIDAGADIVIGHHPHVLQGFEIYRGHLIAYSLGNFLFDQDYLSTFQSLMLRTVFDGDQLMETRVIPIVLDRYRPVPATGATAERIARSVNASSLLDASTIRVSTEVIGSMIDPAVGFDAVLRRDGTGYTLDDDAPVVSNTYALGEDGFVTLPECAVVRPTSETDQSALVGIDLLGWGSLDDGTADRVNDGGQLWRGDGGTRFDRERGTFLHLESAAHASASARQVARSEVPHHRWFDSAGRPVDGEPSYTVQFELRRAGDAPHLRLALYDVTDVPNDEPSSTKLQDVTIDLPVTAEDAWRTVTVDISELVNAEYDGVRPEALMMSVVAPPGDSRIDIDNVRLYEWRTIADLPPGLWMPADALSVAPTEAGAAGAPVDVALDVHGCTPPS